jgi:hypothetical protein
MLLSSSIIRAQSLKELAGEWQFDAPNAPEGSTFGNVIIKNDTVTMVFEGAQRFPSDWVKVKQDSVIYQTSFESDVVRFSLKVVDDQNMSGKAVWQDGETPITLKRKKS